MLPESAPATQPEPSKSLLLELFDRRRVLIVVGVLVAEYAIFTAGIFTPIAPSDVHIIANQTNSQFASIRSANPADQVFFIFSHNLAIALAEMIPALGAILLVGSAYLTGVAAQALLVSQGVPPQVSLFLFVLPFTLVELSAYAMAVTAGVMLIVRAVQKRFMREVKVFLLEIGAVALTLLVAAVMETVTNLSPLVGLVLWLPTALTLVAIMLVSVRGRK